MRGSVHELDFIHNDLELMKRLCARVSFTKRIALACMRRTYTMNISMNLYEFQERYLLEITRSSLLAKQHDD